MSECPGPTHYAGCSCHEQAWENKWQCAVEMAAQAQMRCQELEQENAQLRTAKNAAVAALMMIEERYTDGCDTHEDWRFMGDIARAFFEENPQIADE